MNPFHFWYLLFLLSTTLPLASSRHMAYTCVNGYDQVDG